jgi:hypothetical protein
MWYRLFATTFSSDYIVEAVVPFKIYFLSDQANQIYNNHYIKLRVIGFMSKHGT